MKGMIDSSAGVFSSSERFFVEERMKETASVTSFFENLLYKMGV